MNLLAMLLLLIQAQPLHHQEQNRHTHRIIRMRVYLDQNGDVQCAIDDPNVESLMRGLDGEIAAEMTQLHTIAARNAFRLEWLRTGERIHLKGYNDPYPPHASLHLSIDAGDEIEWFSPEGLDFEINVSRNPMLVLATHDGPADSIRIGENTNEDNPFTGTFPLRSNHGEAVKSGASQNSSKIQIYFMYRLSSSRSKHDLDPDIICGSPIR